jgi:hypothetical protein
VARRQRPEDGTAPLNCFYLIIGGPPVSYHGNLAPPAIFNVEIAEEAQPDVVEQAQTMRSLGTVATKVPMLLVPAPPASGRADEHRCCLLFSVDTEAVSVLVEVFVTAAVAYDTDDGVQTRPLRGAAQPQFRVLRERVDVPRSGVAMTTSPFPLSLLLPHGEAEKDFPAAGPSDERARSAGLPWRVPVAIRIEYDAPQLPTPHSASASASAATLTVDDALEERRDDDDDDDSPSAASPRAAVKPEHNVNRARRHVHHSLWHVNAESAVAETKTAAAKNEELPTHRLTQLVQLLHVGDELFRLDDVFDATGGEPVKKSGKKKKAGDEGADASGDDDGDDGAVAVIDDDDDSNLCVVCLTMPRDTLILPCRHLCLCVECSQVLRHQHNKCPMCRKAIDRLMTMTVAPPAAAAATAPRKEDAELGDEEMIAVSVDDGDVCRDAARSVEASPRATDRDVVPSFAGSGDATAVQITSANDASASSAAAAPSSASRDPADREQGDAVYSDCEA